MSNYKRNLLQQFKTSQGIDISSNNPTIYMSDFAPWILERQEIGNNYTDFLQHLDFYFESARCAEVGKSQFDTVVKQYDTTIITPTIEGLEKLDEAGRVINGTFEVSQDRPSVILPTKEKIIIPQSEIRIYMTQNPYSESNIANWHRLHNRRKAGIIVGIYGSVYDKDIDAKIKQLEKLKEKLNDSIKEEFEVYNDEYYYVIGSDIKVKKLCKILTR